MRLSYIRHDVGYFHHCHSNRVVVIYCHPCYIVMFNYDVSYKYEVVDVTKGKGVVSGWKGYIHYNVMNMK